FLAISQDEADAMQEQFAALSPTEQRSHRNDQILRACKDWRDVVDAAGNAIPFSEDALRRMLQYSWSRIGIFDAYAASLAPGAARQGN
ncbi:MAG: hypothetical protein J0H60_22870, partial [Rhizobiales bacterium]|nr:hypothetical protein [Hyphomicrobiales bacterium]